MNLLEDKNAFLEKKDIFSLKLTDQLKDESSDFFESITKGTSGKTAMEQRFKSISGLIQEVINEDS